MARAPAMAGTMLSSSVATVGLALEYRANGEATVAVVGPISNPRTVALWQTALASYRPGKVVMRIGSDRGALKAMPAAAQAMLASSTVKSAPLAFVCAGKACATPVGEPAKLAEVIRRFGNGSEKTAVANEKPATTRPPM
jgi:uncharacterized protein YyaL (SSP411 family)